MAKRKNAGEGYGYMFHGSFAKKADAVAKERKTKGAWVKSAVTKNGWRYLVMSPRTNPIKRKKNPKRELVVEGRKFGTWEKAFAYAKKLAKKLSNRIEVLVREDGHELRHYVDPPAGKNPHELLIMGANPHPTEREFTLPPGSTITIRTNPTNPAERFTSAQAIARGLKKQAPGLIQTKRQRRVAGMVRIARRHKYDWIPSSGGIAPGENPGDDHWMYAAIAELYPGKTLGQLTTSELSQVAQRAATLKHTPRENVELGTYEKGIFHPWTRRPKSRQKKAIRRRNSSASAIREDFTGTPSEWVTSADEPHMPVGDYAQLGELLALYVTPVKGGQRMQIDFRKPRPMVVTDESARQLWFFEGDQDVSESLTAFGARTRGDGLFELGEARRIDYKQRKEHVPDPDVDEWRHEFGEETGVRPTVLFDPSTKRLLLEGGQYEIRTEGIVN